MNKTFRCVYFQFLILMLITPPCCAEERSNIQLTLPKEIYAVVGSEMNLYFANTILSDNVNDYSFQVHCQLGSSDQTRWSILPTEENTGEHPLKLTVLDANGSELASAQSTLKIAPRNAGVDQSVRLLIIGDSLTHASLYPNELARLLNRPGNPKFEMLGSHRPPVAAEGVAHEGYGGWTWHRFLKHYEPNPDGTYRKKGSPFVFKEQDGSINLNLQRYLDLHCEGEPPSVIIFKLGINDCFLVNPENPSAIDQKIDEVFGYADQMIAAFRKIAPEALIGICVTTPGNSRDQAFEDNYQGKYPRKGWKQIQHRLVQRQLKHFGNRESSKLSLIPTELNLDTLAGYPDDNAVHPNKTGYHQIATTIYAWLKHHLNHSPGDNGI